jgi:hypothetical protein
MNASIGAPGPSPGPPPQLSELDSGLGVNVFSNLTITDNQVSDQQLFTA